MLKDKVYTTFPAMHRFIKSRFLTVLAGFVFVSLMGMLLSSCSSKAELVSLSDLEGAYAECAKESWDIPASAPDAFQLDRRGNVTFGKVDAKKLFEKPMDGGSLPEYMEGLAGKLEFLDSQSAPDRNLSSHFYLVRISAKWADNAGKHTISTSGAKLYCYEDMLIIVTLTTDGRELASFRLK